MNNKSIYDMTLDELKRKWVEAYKIEMKSHAMRVCLGIYIDKKENENKKD